MKLQTPSSKMSEEQEKNNVEANVGISENFNEFSLDNLKSHFETCLAEDGSISIDKYLLGYDELYKFLNLLGTIFGWVATELYNKMETVRGHRNSDQAAKYETIQTRDVDGISRSRDIPRNPGIKKSRD